MNLAGNNLVKIYGKRRVVDDLSVNVGTGEVVGLLGPNGAGKTTTFYMIMGAVKPNTGRVLLDEENLTGLPMHRRALRGLGYLAQEPSIFKKLSVEDNLRIVLELQRLTRKQQDGIIADRLEEFHISHLKDQMGFALSGGERRRVEIARTLCIEPKFILLDEPFTGVDPIAINDIQDIVLHLKARGIGVLLTDHNVRETFQITDRSYIINDGKILTEGTPADLVNDPIARKFYLGERFTA